MATRRRRKSHPVILVVEDEPTILALAVSIIEDALGWKTLSAATAGEALAVLQTKKPVTVLFTDIALPDRHPALDGFALARRAVEQRADLRVLYTSGRDQTDGMRALAVERADFLPKPYTREQLVEVLQKLEITG
jgi:CheY-like chemotaxis protein